MTQHIVNVSGGKDSTALYLLALRRGRPFRAIMADTGHEHPITVEYAQMLGERTGGPAVEFVRADFSREIAGKRIVVETKWRREGVPEATIERALAVLHPTGNPFLDLCIWKGRFPSRKAQFCTELLKQRAVWDSVLASALAVEPVVQWLGIRRAESLNRRDAAFTQKVRHDKLHDMMLFRPLIHWTAQNVISFQIACGIDPNPLYRMGMGRVGCFPCINCNKAELAQIGRRFPETVDKLLEWEALVKSASKRGAATFFASDVTPEGAALGKSLKARKASVEEGAAAAWPRADEVFLWAKTGRGGRQFDWVRDAEAEEAGLSCSSQYGLCE